MWASSANWSQTERDEAILSAKTRLAELKELLQKETLKAIGEKFKMEYDQACEHLSEYLRYFSFAQKRK